MVDILTILGAIVLGVAGNAMWDLCKAAYKRRSASRNIVLLNLFKWNQIQTLGLATPILKKAESIRMTHPDSDHLSGLILIPHHGSRAILKNPYRCKFYMPLCFIYTA
jgi:hypothetical protein